MINDWSFITDYCLLSWSLIIAYCFLTGDTFLSVGWLTGQPGNQLTGQAVNQQTS